MALLIGAPNGRKEVFGGEKLTYEEYLDAQMTIGREVYMKGIDASYYYEGYNTFKAEDL